MIARQLKSLLFGICAFVLCAASASAGSLTYNFIEGSSAPNPGEIGATVTVLSPPAIATAGWTTDNPADVLSLNIIDSSLFPSGYTGPMFVDALALNLVSLTGSNIDDAVLQSTTQNLAVAISTTATGFNDPNSNYIAGAWLASAAVPEPSSLLLAGTAGLAGLAGLGRGRADAMGEPSKQKSPLDLDGRRAQRLSVVPILLTFNRRARQLSIPDIGVGAKKRKGTQRLGCLSAPILIAMICIGTGMAYRIAKNPAAVPFTVIAAVALVAAYFLGRMCARRHHV